MLVLTRSPHTKVRIGSNVTVTILGVRGKNVRIGFEAPDHVSIIREELCELQVIRPHEKSKALITKCPIPVASFK